jgi:hypothetical protein
VHVRLGDSQWDYSQWDFTVPVRSAVDPKSVGEQFRGAERRRGAVCAEHTEHDMVGAGRTVCRDSGGGVIGVAPDRYGVYQPVAQLVGIRVSEAHTPERRPVSGHGREECERTADSCPGSVGICVHDDELIDDERGTFPEFAAHLCGELGRHEQRDRTRCPAAGQGGVGVAIDPGGFVWIIEHRVSKTRRYADGASSSSAILPTPGSSP